jgi:protein-tyrosine phosphatase
MQDIHCHILPTVDDGASSKEEALRMAQIAVNDGIDTIFCTSHLALSNDASEILFSHAAAREKLELELYLAGIELNLVCGAEIMLDAQMVSFVAKNPLASLNRSPFFLFEINPFMALQQIPTVLFSAQLSNLQPIFAHPERCPQVLENMDALKEIRNSGALLQLTAMSLTGGFGKKIQQCAEYIVKTYPEDILIASDAHDSRHRVPLLSEAYTALERIAPKARQSAERHIQQILA